MQPNHPGNPRRENKPARLTPWNEYLMSMYGKEAIVITGDPDVNSAIQIVEGSHGLQPLPPEPTTAWRGKIRLINLEHPNCVLDTEDGIVTLFNVNAILIPKGAR